MSQNSSYKCKTVKHSSIENHKAQLHKVGRWILMMIKLSSTQGIINSDQENCFSDFGKEKSNLYTLTAKCIFSILFSIHIPRR